MITTYPYSALRGFCRAKYGDIPLLMTPTVYALNFGALTANQQKTLTAQINANAAFVLVGISAISVDIASSAVIQLTDSSNSYSLSSSAVPVVSYAGNVNNSQYAQSLHYPYWIGANSAFIAQLTNGGTAQAFCDIELIGFHIRKLT